ncbi:flagellar hook-length control protein FliK [Halomonas sp. PAMB 3232]|uniref:flagellar hook-length control protein FliK n=1 Tax=Halomonas sp. PAMB 3232 TaxID=3075221 RepID=UPI00289E497A|nr:flagellar hook-length control protein FliK [Halomonas sp. PAMB 3232]WNL38853.1 flagellar hook-length control protein FliK [Halomonas sp. PAMB 3232]
MTMSLLLQTTQGLRGALSALPGAQTSQGLPGASEGFQSALRQAFDTRTGSAAEPLETPTNDALEAFRDALAALGADVEALDDAELGALFSATEQALSSEALSQGARIDIFAQVLSAADVTAPIQGSDAAPVQSADIAPVENLDTLKAALNEASAVFAAPANTALPLDATQNAQRQASADALDEVQARLALVAAFTDTPKTAFPAAGLTETATTSAAPALSDAAARVLSAVNALQSGTDANTKSWTGSTVDARPAWSGQPLASLYSAATPLDTTALDADAAPTAASLPTSASASAMQGALASAGPTGGEPTLTGAPPAPTTTPSPVAGAIATPVTSPAFAEKLGQQLIQLTQRGGEQQVKLELHPAELGPLTITLKMGEQHTQAQFFSAHAQVRQIIEQAIPQLREALAEQGIALGNTSVGEHGQSKEQAFAQANGTGAQAGGGTADDVGEGLESGVSAPVRLTLDGRVDLYA